MPKNFLRNALHRLCSAAGFDVRLRRNLERNRQQEAIQHWQALWAPLLRAHGIRTILDIGANEGQFAEMVRDACPDVRLISFEPLPACFEKLRQVSERLGNAECHQCALGDTPGEATMFQSTFAPSSSMLPMGEAHKREWPHTAQSAAVTVSVRRLDDVVDPARLDGPVAIKVDVQGFEDRVIAGGTNTFTHAAVAVIETSFYPLYDGQPLFAQVYARMSGLGYRYHGSLESCRSREDSRILQEDSIFVRSPVPDSRG